MKSFRISKHPFRKAKITRSGTLFLFLAFITGIVAINSGNNLVYLSASMMLSFFIFSGLLSYYNLKGIEVEIEPGEMIFAKKPARITVRVSNNSGLPKFLFNVQSSHFTIFIPSIMAKEEKIFSKEVIFPMRGNVKIVNMKLESPFPFDFVKVSIPLSLEGEVLVFPFIKELSLEVTHESGEEDSFNRPGNGDEFFSIKDYKEGTDLRKISWKLSAKYGKIKIIEGEERRQGRVTLFLDNSSFLYGNADEFEDAVSKIASMSFELIKNGIEVRLISVEEFPFSASYSHLINILTYLATIEISDHIPLKRPRDSISYLDILYEK